MLTELEINMLVALSQFTFLTHSQFQLIGISQNLRVLARKTQKLCSTPNTKRPYMGKITYAPAAKIGRVENVYYLTPKGADFLREATREDSANFKGMASHSTCYRDYHHRKNCITVQILIYQLLQNRYPQLSIGCWDRYFEKVGANRGQNPQGKLRAMTRVDLPGENRFVIPDVIFHIQKEHNSGPGLLCAMEMSNGKDTKRVLRQIERHAEALETSAISRKYRLSVGHKVLFFFSERGLMTAIRNRFQEIPNWTRFRHHFLFAHLDDLYRDPENCWRKAHEHPGERDRFYSFLTGKDSNFQEAES